MNKINIESSETVKVEINDTGKYIELNPLDIEFPLKIEKTSNELNRMLNKLEQELKLIDKKTDVQDGLMSRNTKDKILKYKEYNIECGKVIDELFGQGTVKAAFGNKNYIGMYNDLFDSLAPVLKEVYGNPDSTIASLKKKYSKQDSDVLKWLLTQQK